jgi:hypothetical protein
LKKQVDTQDARVQDLKRTALADQTEIQDLRTKLRAAEAERVAFQTKYEESVRTKQIVGSADVARRDELQKQERRIVELETALDGERRRREDAESQLRDTVTAKAEEAARRSGENAKARIQLEQVQAEITQAKAELDADRKRGEVQREELVEQLEALRDMLGQAAAQYGNLVSETVSKAAYDKLWCERNSLQFHTFRLERKLANTEAQVAELASLIRQSQDANGLLEAELRATEEHRISCFDALEDLSTDLRSDGDSTHSQLVDRLYAAHEELLLSELEIQVMLSSSDRRSAQSYAALNDELASSCVAMRADLDAEQVVSQAQAIQLQAAKAVQEATTADLHAVRTDLESTRKQFEETLSLLSAVRMREAALVQEVEEVRTQNEEQATAQKQALQKEKETVAKLASSLQQSKVAEEELRAEVSQ